MKNVKVMLAMLFMAATASAQEIEFGQYTPADAKNTEPNYDKTGAGFTQTGNDYTTWNYGTINKATSGVRYFKFTNIGTAPLTITSAQGSCGCLVPGWPKEPIMPGATGYIRVQYDTNRLGAFTKYVTLITNAKSNTTTRLKVEGTVNDKSDAPPSNTQFGK